MSSLIKYMVLSVLFLVMPTLADYNPFSNIKNARELMTQARRMHFQVRFRYRPAGSISQFDKVDEMHVSGRVVYAIWHNSFRMKDFAGKGIDEVKKELRNSNITSKILYTPTTSNLYNRVYKQSISPGKTIYAKGSPAHRSSSQNSSYGHYETIKVRSFSGTKTKRVWVQGPSSGGNNYSANNTPYDAKGNVLLTLYVYRYAGAAKKMIDLKGLTLQEAKSKIKKYKLPIGYVQDTYKSTMNPKLYGKIFNQSIKPGTLIVKPKYIGVQIYSMPKIKMPDLTKGWTVKKATKTGYLSLIPLYTKTFDEKKDGIIFHQSIKPGTILRKKTLLVVKAYKYKNLYYRIDYINLNKDAAIQKANQRHLKYKLITKDIFKYFHSTTLSKAFYKEFNNTVVDVVKDGGTIVFTIIKYMQKEEVMPNLVDKTCLDATGKMLKLGRSIPGLTYKMKFMPELVFEISDTVAKTEPKAGGKIKTFDNVIIYCRRFTGDQSKTKAKIPNIRRKTKTEAIKILNNLGFKKIKIVKIKEGGFVQGTVVDVTGNIAHSAIGYTIFKRETIHLYIADSKADEVFLMPNVVGLTMKKARELLLARGFNNIKFTDEVSSWVKYKIDLPKGNVISSYPSYKGLVRHSDEVELIVRLKKGEKLLKNIKNKPVKTNTYTTVPALKKRVSDTIKILKERGLSPVRSNIILTTDSSLDGTVQLDYSDPSFNTIVKKGTRVFFSVYSINTKVPYVMGLSKKDAISRIKQHLLVANVTYESTTKTDKIDTVLSQNPSPNSSIKCGSKVDLTIYKKADKFIKMPDIKMKKYGQDITDLLLKKYGLKAKVLGSVGTTNKDYEGKISSTQPDADSSVAVGSIVNIFLYKFSNTKFKIGRFRFSKRLSKPSVSKQPPKLSSEVSEKIHEFYRSFKEAYEAKDESSVVSFLSSDWTSASGGDVSDMEDNLNRTFRVFDEIEYGISGLNIHPMGDNRYKVSYNLNIIGQIYDDDITHEEKSSVQEEVLLKNGKVEIEKTLGGRYWSIK